MRNAAPRDGSELEALETREWLESLEYVIDQGDRGRVQRLLAALRHHARMQGVSLPFTRDYAIRQYHPRRRADAAARQSGNRAPHQEPGALERDGDGGARQPAVGRHRRPHLHVRLGGDAVRDRLQPFLPRQRDEPAATPTSSTSRVMPSPGIYARAFLEGRLPPRSLQNFRRELADGRRAVVVSAPVADAGLLAVPDRVDGPRSDHVDLPGAVQPLPRRSRAQEAVGAEGVGVPRRRRDRRARVARRDQPRGAREARQPDLRHQLQPAAPRRPGARQRPDHPGARGRASAAPAGT